VIFDHPYSADYERLMSMQLALVAAHIRQIFASRISVGNCLMRGTGRAAGAGRSVSASWPKARCRLLPADGV